MGESNWLDRVYKAETPAQIEQAYDGWAEEYEADVFQYGYTTTAVVTGLVCRYVRTKAVICEAGVGTGLLGESLHILGYSNIDGFDISDGMLGIAEKKKSYRSLQRMTLGKKLGYSTEIYDAVVSMGTFTVGHAPASGFDELVRITKPGGFIIVSIRIDQEETTGFLTRINALKKLGKWKLEEQSTIFRSVPLGEPEVENRAFVFKKL
jgi:predicted TPR repeat methyltransferase